LRHLRIRDQREGARTARADDRLSAPHAHLPRRGRPDARALARRAFPVVKDLVVDRGAFDRIIAAGGFVSAPVGGAQDGNTIPIPKENADLAMDAAACIGCAACVAACPNAAAMLFVSAKVSQLALLPQGQPERRDRVRRMVARMDAEGFGTCTNHGECEAACPKGIGWSSSAA
jgi:succinate dehydrogenase / fumarate reductase iron-sulfur subunit